MTGEPYTVFGYGGKQVRDNIHAADLVAAFEAFHRAPRAAAVYNIGGGRAEQLLDARGDRALPGDRRARARAGPSGEENRIGDHRWWISDLEPFKRDYPDWEITHDVRDILREIHDRNVERWVAQRMKLSVVIPAHNEGESIGATVEAFALRAAARADPATRSSSSTTRAPTAPRRWCEPSPQAIRAVRCIRSPRSPGFGQAVRAGLDDYTGDAVAIVMADLSDSPEDLVRYYRVLEQGFDCAFGSRFVRGGRVSDYPRFKLVLNRLVNLGIRVLFRHGYNDTTNAFKAYRREVIDHIQPLLSNHFNLTVEMPLKAIVRGHSLRDRADLLDQPRAAASRSSGSRRWAAATCSSSSTCSSSTTSAAATTAGPICSARTACAFSPACATNNGAAGQRGASTHVVTPGELMASVARPCPPAAGARAPASDGRLQTGRLESAIGAVERNWAWALAGLMLLSGALLLYMGRGLSFFYDDWDLVVNDYGGGLHSLLPPTSATSRSSRSPSTRCSFTSSASTTTRSFARS